MNTNRQFSRIRTATLAVSSLALMFSMSAFARLDGAIFTTTPLGDIVNENVRYQSKEEVFLDGGPGPNAPSTAAALPEGLYYFQVTDPSGKCLLSSMPDSAGSNGGTCEGDQKVKGPKSSGFMAEPLDCRLFEFDGHGAVSFLNDVVMIPNPAKGKKAIDNPYVAYECTHLLGSEYLADMGLDPNTPDGETVQLYPFADTPNPGGVYKAWVSTRQSVLEACGKDPESGDLDPGETGVGCAGFNAFIPRNSKTDNFKARTVKRPQYFDIAIRKFHDKNLSCDYDEGDEVIHNWEFGIRDLDMYPLRNTKFSNDSATDPIRFSVFGQENNDWSVDQFMWWAYKYVTDDFVYTPMNTPFTHFGTFANLKKFGPTFDDVDLVDDEGNPIEFRNVFACPEPENEVISDNIRRSTGEDSDRTANSDEPADDSGFIPSAYAEPTFDDDPVLTVRFGSIGMATLKVCKSFDTNGDGVHDEGEALIPSWPVTLEIPASVPVPKPFNRDDNEEFSVIEELLHNAGILPEGVELAPIEVREGEEYAGKGYVTKYTAYNVDDEGEPLDGHGCAEFYVLVPNVRGEDPAKYKISEDIENLDENWSYVGDAEVTFDVESTLTYIAGETEDDPVTPRLEGVVVNRSDEKEGEDKDGDNEVYFNNVCTAKATFYTKGYWHNKNGLGRLTEDDQGHVNGLAPYSSPSLYFDAGDEPFDGFFTGGAIPVDAAFNDDGTKAWTAGTWQSEVSHFLVDRNADAEDHLYKEQLAQQLLAFIFNTRHQLNNSDGTIKVEGEVEGEWEWIPVGDIIDRAIAAWLGTDTKEIQDVKNLLDYLNNNKYKEGAGIEILVSSPEDCTKPYPSDPNAYPAY